MALPLVLLAALSSMAAEPVIDPALVQSLASSPPGLMKAHPYVAHFKKKGFELYFVSALHENGTDSETFRLLERCFERFAPRRVVVEGNPYALGDFDEERLGDIRGEAKGGSFRWGEGDYAAYLADKKGLKTVGGEPTAREEADASRAAGFTDRDILGMAFVKMVPSYRIQRRTGEGRDEALFLETMGWTRKSMGLKDDGEFEWMDFLRWYREKTGARFDPGSITHATCAPDPTGGFLNRLAETETNSRNRFLAGVLTKELAAHKKVLAVYGNGHHAALRKAVEKAFGRPVYEGDLAP